MAFGDADGAISLLTAADEGAILPLNGFEGQPVEWADPPEPVPEIEWTDSTLVALALLQFDVIYCFAALSAPSGCHITQLYFFLPGHRNSCLPLRRRRC